MQTGEGVLTALKRAEVTEEQYDNLRRFFDTDGGKIRDGERVALQGTRSRVAETLLDVQRGAPCARGRLGDTLIKATKQRNS